MTIPKCEICGEPMPDGEDMFKIHGYSGPCPKPSLGKSSDICPKVEPATEMSGENERKKPENMVDLLIETAQAFANGCVPHKEFHRCRQQVIDAMATPPGSDMVPEGTMAIIKAHVGEAYQIAVIKGMALSHIINGSATADKEAFTFANQKNDWGRISRSMRLALDALTRHRATQKETPMPKTKLKTPKTEKMWIAWDKVDGGFYPARYGDTSSQCQERINKQSVFPRDLIPCRVRIMPEAEYQRLKEIEDHHAKLVLL